MGLTVDYSIVGKTFGYLTVKELYRKPGNRRIYWVCRCVCGKEKIVAANHLADIHDLGHCGCTRKTGRNLGLGTVERQYLSSYKRAAKYRGINFNLSDEYAISIMHKDCYYCGNMDTRFNYKHGDAFKLNGIDRVDNSKDYNIDNVVPCCKECNSRKKNITVDAMIKSIQFLGYSVERSQI